jgi:3-phosphoshikimate 1-carboxyvinyltransferase
VLKYDEIGKICWLGENYEAKKKPCINTYNDHRIAMSMAVVGLIREIEIENIEVVNKSYPEFWREFDRVKSICCK